MKTYAVSVTAGLLFLLASSATAAGQTDNATEKARANFRQGVQLYNEGSFEAALAEFRKAYQLSPSYRLLYNIAQTCFELHDYVNAYKTLQQYLQEGGNEIASARRIQVDELNQKLEERIAYMDIACNLDGADIRVDDISVGVSPLQSAVLVNAGPRRISAVKAGFPVAARMVTVVGTEKAKVIMEIPTPVQTSDEKAKAPEPAAASTKSMPTLLGTIEPETKRSQAGLITSLAVAGGCAVATGVVGFLALKAKGDFENELDKIPNTKANVDSARSKMKNYAYLTDALGAATLISGGVALYLVLTSPGESGQKKHSGTKHSVALVPTVGGMVLHGEW